MMLHVTAAAEDAIRSLVRYHGLEYGGLRITLVRRRGNRAGLALSVADAPWTTDEVITSTGGCQIFVQRAATGFVRGQLLDAEEDQAGHRFAMRPHS